MKKIIMLGIGLLFVGTICASGFVDEAMIHECDTPISVGQKEEIASTLSKLVAIIGRLEEEVFKSGNTIHDFGELVLDLSKEQREFRTIVAELRQENHDLRAELLKEKEGALFSCTRILSPIGSQSELDDKKKVSRPERVLSGCKRGSAISFIRERQTPQSYR